MEINELIKRDLEINNLLEKYVILKKDEQGYYIEYAFRDGAPHDNRCLDWYHSYQEKAYIRNNWTENMNDEEAKEYLDSLKDNRDKNVGFIFKLSSLTCGGEENPDEQSEKYKVIWDLDYPNAEFIPENHICRVGCPSKRCLELCAKHWTYDEPVKCACWHLSEKMTMEEFVNGYCCHMKASDLLKIING